MMPLPLVEQWFSGSNTATLNREMSSRSKPTDRIAQAHTSPHANTNVFSFCADFHFIAEAEQYVSVCMRGDTKDPPFVSQQKDGSVGLSLLQLSTFGFKQPRLAPCLVKLECTY